MTLGGRVAEELFIGRITTGARDDLRKVTQQAYAQITNYGMDPVLGPFNYADQGGSSGGSPEFTKPFSEATAQLIDQQARLMITKSLERTRELLAAKRDAVEALAQRLLEREVLVREDLIELLGERPFPNRHAFDELVTKKK
jgi:AFG3 family protein